MELGSSFLISWIQSLHPPKCPVWTQHFILFMMGYSTGSALGTPRRVQGHGLSDMLYATVFTSFGVIVPPLRFYVDLLSHMYILHKISSRA